MDYEIVVVIIMAVIAGALFFIARYINSIKRRMEFGETSIVYAILHDEYITPLTRVHDTLEDYYKAHDNSKSTISLNVDSILYDIECLMNVAQTLKMATLFNQEEHIVEREITDLIEVLEETIEDLGDVLSALPAELFLYITLLPTSLPDSSVKTVIA